MPSALRACMAQNDNLRTHDKSPAARVDKGRVSRQVVKAKFDPRVDARTDRQADTSPYGSLHGN
jgi:hypothetical protein